MPLRNRLMGTGLSAEEAIHICGGVTAISAAGTTTADAATLTNAVNNVTVGASNAGVKLLPMNPGEDQYVFNNATGNTIKVYPPAGGSIQNGSADAAVTLANNKAALFKCITPLIYSYVVTG